MSADNGIYILITPHPSEDNSREHRVAVCSAIENIHSEESEKYLLMYFGKCEPMANRIEAMSAALDLYDKLIDDGGIVEYGVQQIKLDTPFPILAPV